MEDATPRRPAVAAIAAAVCLVPVIALGDKVSFLLPVAGLLAIFAFWGVRRLIEARPGSVGTWLMTAGGGLFAVLGLLMYGTFLVTGNDPEGVYPSWLFIGFPIGGLSFAAGLVLFTIGAIRSGLPKAPFLLMVLFLPVGLVIDALTGASGGAGAGVNIGFGMLAAGLLWLGAYLWSRPTSAG